MTTILVDHHLERFASRLLGILVAGEWLDLVAIRFVSFSEVGLAANAPDRVVWRFAQEQQMLLLTANRNMKGEDSLETTLREEITPESLPVITISRVDRTEQTIYHEQCTARLLDFVLDLDRYRGVPRLFIP